MDKRTKKFISNAILTISVLFDVDGNVLLCLKLYSGSQLRPLIIGLLSRKDLQS